MHPRYRRTLIPGLLVILLVVVVAAAVVAADRERGERVAVIDDDRIAESSALVVSVDEPDLAYTINDSGNEAAVYAIDLTSGDVVGVTSLAGQTMADTEALALGPDGRLWVADIGDNDAVRADLALYALPEPGRGDSTVTPKRYPVRYSDGARDAETLLISPEEPATMYVVTKEIFAGAVYRLPGRLRTDRPNVMRPIESASAPSVVTDGGFLPDGSGVVLRTYGNVYVQELPSWEETWTARLPAQEQGESIAVEQDASALIGTEGIPSPILRVPLQVPEPADDPSATSATSEGSDDEGDGGGETLWLAGGAVVVAVIGAMLFLRRRTRPGARRA